MKIETVNTWHPEVIARRSVELALVHGLAEEFFHHGFVLAVEDTEDGPVDWCYDFVELFGQLAECDDEILIAKHNDGRQGHVQLVWGNGHDVICDYSAHFERIVELGMDRLYTQITDSHSYLPNGKFFGTDRHGEPYDFANHCPRCGVRVADYVLRCPWCLATDNNNEGECK